MLVGIDVGKDRLDRTTAPNDPHGEATITTRVVARSATLVAVEATGGCEHPLAASLALAGVPVAVG